MVLEIADDIMHRAGLDAEDLRLRVAIILFQDNQITLGSAAQIAHLHLIQFQKELAKRHIPIHYDETDFERDLVTISTMAL